MDEEFENTNKTEDPTQKRLEEALKRGDVVKSQEVNTWFVIAGAAIGAAIAAGVTASTASSASRARRFPAWSLHQRSSRSSACLRNFSETVPDSRSSSAAAAAAASTSRSPMH